MLAGWGDGDRDRVPSLPREVRQSRRNARDRVGNQLASGLGNCVTFDIRYVTHMAEDQR